MSTTPNAPAPRPVGVRVIRATIEEVRAMRLLSEDDLDVTAKELVGLILHHFIELKRLCRQRGNELERILIATVNQ